MLLLIVPVFVWFFVWTYFAFAEGDGGFGFFIGMVSALLALIITFCVGMSFQGAPTEVAYSETYEIHALVDNARYSGRVSGNIYLVQSHVNENLKYSYMYMVEGKGYYAFDEVLASCSYLNYTDDKPYMVRNVLEFQNETLESLFGYWGNNEYIFYLPQGAEVIDDFVINFE